MCNEPNGRLMLKHGAVFPVLLRVDVHMESKHYIVNNIGSLVCLENSLSLPGG
jgi:hypothetical protein